MPADCSVIRTETFLFRGRMEITMKETDKRLEANRLVKLRIARALTKLMEKKNFSDITVTEIVQTAGVARASYYRNFTSKEEVLIKVTDGRITEKKPPNYLTTFSDMIPSYWSSATSKHTSILSYAYIKQVLPIFTWIFSTGS